MRIELAKTCLREFTIELSEALKNDPYKAKVMIERLIHLYAGLDEDLIKSQHFEITKDIETENKCA